jgi:hypothetical protein
LTIVVFSAYNRQSTKSIKAMTISFSEFIKSKAITARLPFDIDFDICPCSDFERSERVAGFDFPVFNELLTREAWFFELLEEANSASNKKFKVAIKTLSSKLQLALGIESQTVALQMLLEPTAEQIADGRYDDFMIDNSVEVEEVIDLFKQTQDNLAFNWLRVTFFIASRLNPGWTLGDTVNLRKSQISDILAFILLEANGGVIEEPITEPSGEGAEGKTQS